MNPLVRKARSFRSVCARQGCRAAAEATARSLANSVAYRWGRAGLPGRKRRGALPDNDRYGAAAFLPSTAGARPVVRPGSVAVVIPVYGGYAGTRDCIASVVAAGSPAVGEVVVVDDASPEPALVAHLDDLAHRGSVRLLRNALNLGFVASVNRGVSAAGDRDVIVLNSDTLVAGDWADRIAAHACGARVGTVTPYSNNATICSYPRPGVANDLPEGETAESLDTAFAAANRGRHCDLPTAVGFCMFVSRACLRDVGPFDEQTFGRGYGEENDFCLRAAKRGWRNVLAADAYVWHRGEVSFGPAASRLQTAALDTLRRRYPGYLPAVARHVEEDPGRPWRAAATAVRFRTGPRPVVLMVLHAYGTGTERHALDLCRRYAGQVRFLVLRATFQGPVRLYSPDPEDGLDVLWRTSDGSDGLAALVASFGVARVHIHQILGLPLDAPALIEALGVPFDFTVHDYFALCPRVRLTTPPTGYCGEPEPERCAACLRRTPRAAATDIGSWQRRHGWLLAGADRVICPSRDAAARLRPFVPPGRLVVAPHDGLDHQAFPAPHPVAPGPGERLRVAVLGVLSNDKGARAVAGHLRRTQGDPAAPEVVLVGYVDPESAATLRGVTLPATGPYRPEEVPALLRELHPHVVWFPASWPETYSYTLSEAMAEGLPVVAPDIGAFAERLAGRPWSWILPWDATPEQSAACFDHARSCLERGVFDAGRYATGKDGPPAASAPAADLSFYDRDYLQPLRDVAVRAHGERP